MKSLKTTFLFSSSLVFVWTWECRALRPGFSWQSPPGSPRYSWPCQNKRKITVHSIENMYRKHFFYRKRESHMISNADFRTFECGIRMSIWSFFTKIYFWKNIHQFCIKIMILCLFRSYLNVCCILEFTILLSKWHVLFVHCNENPNYLFPEKELRGLSPHSCVCERFILYIPGFVHIFSFSRIGSPMVGINKSLTNTWMVKLGLRPRNSFSGNIYFKVSVLCLCSVSLLHTVCYPGDKNHVILFSKQEK